MTKCECGGKYSKNHKSRHMKTKKHLKSVYRLLKNLELKGLIEKIGYPNVYQVTGEGRFFAAKKMRDANNTFNTFPLGVKKMRESEKVVNLPFSNVRLHAFSVKFPLLERGAQASWWDRMEKMRGGWVKCWKFLLDKGVKVECSHKSVIIHFASKYVRLSFKDFDSVRFQRLSVASEVHKYLGLRGVVFDLGKGVVVRQHGASRVEGNLKGKLGRGVTEDVFLGRGAVGVWPAGFEAKAWIDSSKGFEFEANDDLYWRRWLLVPENVESMRRYLPELGDILKNYMASIKLYDAQIQKHLDVMEKIGGYFDLLKKKEEEGK